MNKKHIEDDSGQRFDRFKEDFFSALQKLNKMQDIANILRNDAKNAPVIPQSKLAESILESVKFVEESAYAKLVKHLKQKIKVFDTPLENQPEFLVFMKVTFKMLRQKSIEMYGHIINELIQSRAKYIQLSYNEKTQMIYAQPTKNSADGGKSATRNVALQVAWLHEALLNEVSILDHTALD